MAERVDVVILSWNRRERTLEAIESALAQRGVEVHVQVVDQGSAEEVLQGLRPLAAQGRITLRELGRNVGVAAGRNLAMGLGTSPVVVALDNDAEFEDPGALSRVAARFAAEPSLGAVGFRILNASTREDDRLSWVYPRPLRARSGEGFEATRFCGAGHALRRSALEKTRGYDERLFFYWEELDLSYQLIREGYRIVYEPGVRVLHKVDPEARTDWGRDRFYYLVRNALYLEYRHFGLTPRLLAQLLGYPLKGAVNGVEPQALRGILHGLRMMREAGREPAMPREGLRYLEAHDTLPRGGLLRRVREELLERLR
jgi:GT2 family glycosyltransferase